MRDEELVKEVQPLSRITQAVKHGVRGFCQLQGRGKSNPTSYKSILQHHVVA